MVLTTAPQKITQEWKGIEVGLVYSISFIVIRQGQTREDMTSRSSDN